MASKTCTKCKQALDVAEFYKDATRKDGLRSWCRTCVKEYSRQHYQNNPDKVKEHKRKWKKNNPDNVKEHKNKWAKSNPDKVRGSRRKWAKNNPEKIKEIHSQWAKKNPEKIRAIKVRRRARKTGTYCSPTDAQDRRRIKEEQPVCIKCGSTDRLAIDHKLPVVWGGASCYMNYQVLCIRCNSSKGIKYADWTGETRALLTIDIGAHKTEQCSQLSNKITESDQFSN